jgi:glucan phosphoethanolaminetransferase (alkaline phosphatase superfamily)|nr:sulfatase-like hydrolase/transferase [uncultured Flavobacterium sp.]
MKEKSIFVQFSLLFLVQIILSTVVIVIFQQTFDLKPIIIIGHLFVICIVNFAFILFGVSLHTIRFFENNKFIKYFVSLIYGVIILLISYAYLFAFLGKSLNSRIFTIQIVLGYLKHLNGLIHMYSIHPIFIYSGLLVFPLFIIISFLFSAQFIDKGFQVFKQCILNHNFNNPPLFIRIKMVVFLFFLGFASGVLLIKCSSISRKLFQIEEPIVSFFFKNSDPFQGQILANDNEDISLRKNYKKNIDFQKKNVIIIVVDALRSDHLSLYGYKRHTSPFLDSLYASGDLKKIKTSFSVASGSFPGVNSILRSKIWANMGFNNFSVQQLLKDQGYDINFLVSGDHTHFYGLKSFYGNDSDFNYYIDGSNTKKYIVADDRIIFEGLKNIKKYNKNPSFFYFHLNSAHSAGTKIDRYKMYRPANVYTINIENYTNRYDNGILQADDYVKKIFFDLRLKGYLQNSIVVITADHGEALGERGEFGHVKNVYTDQILIPILIYDTDKLQYKNLIYATSVDIAPTIIDRLGLPIPESWEGKSLLSDDNREFTFHQMGNNYAIINKKGKFLFKYIYDSKLMKEELYELNGDFYENNNLINSVDKKWITDFRKRLSEFRIKPF